MSTDWLSGETSNTAERWESDRKRPGRLRLQPLSLEASSQLRPVGPANASSVSTQLHGVMAAYLASPLALIMLGIRKLGRPIPADAGVCRIGGG